MNFDLESLTRLATWSSATPLPDVVRSAAASLFEFSRHVARENTVRDDARRGRPAADVSFGRPVRNRVERWKKGGGDAWSRLKPRETAIALATSVAQLERRACPVTSTHLPRPPLSLPFSLLPSLFLLLLNEIEDRRSALSHVCTRVHTLSLPDNSSVCRFASLPSSLLHPFVIPRDKFSLRFHPIVTP